MSAAEIRFKLMHLIVIPLIILLSGCTSNIMGNYYSQTVRGWQGGRTTELVKRWGLPDQQVRGSNGNTLYVYKTKSYHNSTAPSAATSINFRPGGHPMMVSIPNNTWNRGMMSTSCITAFEANKQGTIVATQVVGNGCYGDEGFAKSQANPKA